MSSLAEIFGECRSLLYGPRSQASFELLLAQIERAYELIGDDVEDAGLMRYTREGIAAWPAELRYVPLAKLDALLDEGGGGLTAQLSLCAALRFDWGYRATLEYAKRCELLWSDALSSLESISLSAQGSLPRDFFDRGGLCGASCLAGLKRLEVDDHLLGFHELPDKIVALPPLRAPSLEALILTQRSLSPALSADFLSRAQLPSLKRLVLNRVPLTPELAQTLRGLSFWSGLEQLGLRRTKLRGDAWKEIFKELGTLRGVDLGFNTLPAPLLAWLLQSAGPAQVERLGLESVAPKGSAAAALGMFEWPKLRELDLSFVVLSSAELGQILARMRHGALRELRLNSCGLMPDAPWELLGQCGAFERLSLRDNTLDLAAIDRLVASGALDAVVELDLARCAFGEAATVRLLDGLAGGPIKRLELSHNGLTIESWRRLLSHPALAGLEWLGVGAQREPESWMSQRPDVVLLRDSFEQAVQTLKPGWAWS